ncbi:hypothetical protein GCM10020221_10070 [Streptomyces thioluteus]|uniref:Uncharacterized protein n=1 Tax=Streptomyces thioluteus TaxID=66431 RepID=A0ABP6J0P1_STRTU
MLAMFASFRPADGLSRPRTWSSWSSPVSAPCSPPPYLLVVVRRVCMGGNGEQHPAGAVGPALTDVRPYEFAAWTPLVVLTVLAGLWPAALLGLTDPAVQQLLGGGN